MTSTPAPVADFLNNTSTVATADGRQLTTYAAGSPSSRDLVVLESGLGTGAAYWGPTVNALTSLASASAPVRVLAYDRAGYGTSSPATDARTLAHLADDLLAVIDAHEYSRLVLVGHSWGGPIIRRAAAQLASRAVPATATATATDGGTPAGTGTGHVAGLVLVDASDELCPRYDTALMRLSISLQGWLVRPLNWVGLLGVIARSMVVGLPEPYLSAAYAASVCDSAARASSYEVGNVIADLRGLLAQPAVLDARITVISGTEKCTPGSIREALVAAHKERVDKEKNGKHVAASKSEHMVPITEPELIAREALALLTS